jgi:DNA-binding GntR family transcriptional regulator
VPSNLYDQLRDEIVYGQLKPGTPLVELAVASRYGASRTPVREALRRLEQDGLVERGERGMQVRARSPEEILEIYDVRIQLEAWAARAAAERRTAFDLAQLEELHTRMLNVRPGDSDAMVKSNRAFHEALWTSSHNKTLVDLLTRLQGHLTRFPATTLSRTDRWPAVLAEHRKLIDAIANRDADSAAELAASHMTAARDIRFQLYIKDADQ